MRSLDLPISAVMAAWRASKTINADPFVKGHVTHRMPWESIQVRFTTWNPAHPAASAASLVMKLVA